MSEVPEQAQNNGRLDPCVRVLHVTEVSCPMYQTQRYCADMPHPEGKFVMYVSRKLSVVGIAVPRLFIPTFVHALYSRIGSKSIRETSLSRMASVSSFKMKSANIRSLVVDVMPFTFRGAIL